MGRLSRARALRLGHTREAVRGSIGERTGRIPRAALMGMAAPPALVPTLPEPRIWRRPMLSAGFAVGWVLSLGALGTFTAVWLLGLVATTLFFTLGTGGLGSVIVLVFAGILVIRGWVGMVQTARDRLRRRDLSEPPALPDAFWALSPGIQRLVRHARSLRIVLEGSEPSPPQIDREMFEWIASMAGLPARDRDFLAQRNIDAEDLREHLILGLGPRAGARQRGPRDSSGHRALALSLLDRFERQVLGRGGDPFRGGISRSN